MLVPNSSARNCKFSLQVHNCRSLKLINIKAFTFVDEPHVMVQVGDEGDAGVVEIQDLLFTSTAPSFMVAILSASIRLRVSSTSAT